MQQGGLAERLIAVCCGVTIVALWIVGVTVHEVVRHLIQGAPLFVGVVFGLRGSDLTRWAAFGLGLVWAALMGLVALHLTGVAHIVTGTFSPREVNMVWVIGGCSLAQIALALVSRSDLKLPTGLAVLIGVAVLQLAAVEIGFQPAFAHDQDSLIHIDD